MEILGLLGTMARIGLIFRNRLLQFFSRPKRLAVLEACLIGLVAGLAAVSLGYSIGWLGGWRQQSIQIFPAYIALPAIGLVGGLIAGWLVEDVAPGSSGSGMAEVKAVLANVPMPLNLWLAIVKWVSTSLVLAAGMPLGREGPTVQIGAALANQLSQWFPTSPEHRRQLIAAGAGAGLAAAFDAPIAGVLFVVEELLQDVSGITLGMAILASFVASAIARLSGSHSLELISHLTATHASFALPEIPFYLLLGVLAGGFGVFFNRGILSSTLFYRRFLPVSLAWRVGLAGMFAGIALATLPNVFRDNAGLRQMLLSGEADWHLVLLVFCVKFCLIVLAGGAGAPGGLLIPSMTLGSALGYLIGSLQFHFLGLGMATTYAHVGMAAFFCAVSRVPITAVVIVFEMTTDFNLVLPLMIGTVASYLVAEKMEVGSLYDRQLAAKGIHLEELTRNQKPWTALTASQVMQSKVETLSSDMTLEESIQTFSQSSHRTFPVLRKGRLVGMISQIDIANPTQRGLTNKTTLSTIMTHEPIRIAPSDTLGHVLHLFDRHNLSSIPVVDGWRLVGIITRSDIIRVEAAYLNGREDLISNKVEKSRIVYQNRTSEIGEGRLLVLIVNFKSAESLLKIAMAIAHDRHYEVEVLHIVVVPRHQSLSEISVKTSMAKNLLSSAMGLGQVWEVPVHTQIRLAHDQSEAILEVIRDYHINLMLMDGKVNPKAIGNRFNRLVDIVVRHADCDVMLVKLSIQKNFERWLIPIMGAGFNANKTIQFLPSLLKLGHKPMITFCQVFDLDSKNPHPIALEYLDKAAYLAKMLFNVEIVTAPIDGGSTGNSIARAILEYAQQDGSDVIVLETTKEEIVHQGMQENILNNISYYSNQTVILLRAG